MTQEFWTLGQALVWFALRDQDCLCNFSEDLRDEPDWVVWLSMKTGRIEPYYSAETIAEIEESLRQELVSGRILSLGFRDGIGDRVPIPLDSYFRSGFLICWSREYLELRGVGVGSRRKGATEWRGVIVRRVEVMDAASRLFPVSQDRHIGDGPKEAGDIRLKSHWTTAELAAWIRTRQVRWVQAMDGSDGGGQPLDQMLAEAGIEALCSLQEAVSEIKASIWALGCSSHEHPYGIPQQYAFYSHRYLRALNDRTELRVWLDSSEKSHITHTLLRFPATEALDLYPDNHGEFEIEPAKDAQSVKAAIAGPVEAPDNANAGLSLKKVKGHQEGVPGLLHQVLRGQRD